MWKIRMVRDLTDKVTPDVKVRSVVNYDLPSDICNMLDSIDMVDPAYTDSIFATVLQHCFEEFVDTGFMPHSLIPPGGDLKEIK